jgi:hypothetical protein
MGNTFRKVIGNGVDASDIERFIHVHTWPNVGQGARHEGLSRTGRTDHNEIVTA